MKVRFLILSMALFACASVTSAQDVVTEELSDIVEEANYEVDFTEEVQPLRLYAFAQNFDDNELINLYYKSNAKTPEQLLAKAKRVRKKGWTIGGVVVGGCTIAGIAMGVGLGSNTKEWILSGVGVGLVGAATVVIGCNLYANSLQKKAYAMITYSAPIIEGDITNIGSNKLMAGVSVMGNQYTHTRGLGMSLKLNF